MKKILIILSLIGLLTSLTGVEISGRLKTEIRLKEQYRRGIFTELPELIKQAPSSENQLIYLHFYSKPDADCVNKLNADNIIINLSSWVPPVKNHPTGFLTAQIPAKTAYLEKLADYREITAITSAERTLNYHNDLASEHTGAAFLQGNEYGLSGAGVKVGVIDSGFQLDHPDLPDPYMAIDYSNYGAVPDSDYTVSNETTHTGHGTHVAGTILGQGTMSDGVWKGMAPGADFLAIKVGHDNSGGIYSAALVHSFYAARFYYDADFVNASLGGWDEYHDGSSEDAQTVDLITEDGCVAFISTGNDVDDNFHYSGLLAGNEISDFIAVDYHDTTEVRSVIYNLNLVWYDGPDTGTELEMDMVFYNEDYQPLLLQSVEDMTQSLRGTQSRYGTATVLGQNPFFVKVLNQSSSPLDFHLYIDSRNGQFALPDPNFTVATPGDADMAISVGSYNTRLEWTNWEGLNLSFVDIELDNLSTFSNRGPRIDGALAPIITAPGVALISARDDDAWGGPPFGLLFTPYVISNSYAQGECSGGLPADYIMLTGTSMSCPAACGSVALLKEYDPYLTREDIISLMSQYSCADTYTGTVPNMDWGYGKLDVAAMLEGIVSTTDEQIPGSANILLYQNYPNPFNPETTISFNLTTESTSLCNTTAWQAENAELCIYNIKGQKVKSFSVTPSLCHPERSRRTGSNYYSITWNGTDNNGNPVPSGIYFYKLSSGNQELTRKMLLLK